MKMDKNPLTAAQEIVAAIERDLSDRCGLSGEWDGIDDEIKEEIRSTWEDLVNAILAHNRN